MILSDVTIREELAAGRIIIDPLGDDAVQPSSVDLHVDRYFRVFRNDTTPYIDPKQHQEDLTELVEVGEDGAFILHPGEFVLGSTLERVALPDDLVARLEGKALALDTEVPTPFGWTTMGELRVGDLVFDAEGEPTRVVAATPPMYNRPCREVVFSDGTSVIADASHLWETVDKNGRRSTDRRARVRSTDEIRASLRVRGENNHQVGLTAPLQYPERVLPISPYVLGIWLGDGTSTKAEITTADQFVVDEIERCGVSMEPKFHRGPYLYLAGGAGHTRDATTGQYVSNSSLWSMLRFLGLLGNKHIPDEYLRGSVEQRTALLQGLMDSDGYVDKYGRCDFTSVNFALAEQVAELVASLGLRPTIAKKRAVLNGVDMGPKYEVQFVPDRPVFRLPRKLARQKTSGRFHRFRAITDVRPVQPVPVRCIEVASPRGLFLITRAHIPTHNSSLGRLGLLIHSSLPASETVMVLVDGVLRPAPIGDVVRKQQQGFVVAFDPATFEVGYHAITGWYEGPPDRIHEVTLRSGRRVRVTAGHNLFTLARDGRLRKMRTAELAPGVRVAVPRRIPDPHFARTTIDLFDAIPESAYAGLMCEGPTIRGAFADGGSELARLLLDHGYRHVGYYAGRGRLPMHLAALVDGLFEDMGPADRIVTRGGRSGLPPTLLVDRELAWFLGIYAAEGSRRRTQFVVSNTDQSILDRAEAVLRTLGLPTSRQAGAVTCTSTFASSVLEWIGVGGKATEKRVPPAVFSWPAELLDAFLEGLVDGDGSVEATRTSVWTTSPGLVADLLVLFARLGRRAGTSWRDRGHAPICQVYAPTNEHKLLTGVPLPDELLVALRERAGLDQSAASRAAGYRHASDLNNIERRCGRDAVRRTTLARLRDVYAAAAADSEELTRLDRLVDGDLLWDEVVEVRDLGVTEPIFDIEVRPGGRHVENFLAGAGGVFVSNTAGFVDAGWDGHLTLELSNVANLPIALYPGMKIGQISFLRMTGAAEHPYGSDATGSKYQGQRGPTPSRYYLNFAGSDDATE